MKQGPLNSIRTMSLCEEEEQVEKGNIMVEAYNFFDDKTSIKLIVDFMWPEVNELRRAISQVMLK